MKLPVVQDASEPWYADGLQFTCTQCGNCCTGGPGFVWLNDVEIDRLATHLSLTRDEVLKRFCRKVGGRISLKEHRNQRGEYDCIFLKEQQVTRRPAGADRDITTTMRVCEIYTVRPLQCRTWPFWPENLESPESWKKSSRRCPGMDEGDRHFPLEKIAQLRDAKDWPANPPTSSPPPAKESGQGVTSSKPASSAKKKPGAK